MQALPDVRDGQLVGPPVNADGTEMTAAEWERLREYGRNNLYFFAKAILRYHKMQPHVHREFAEFIQDPSTKLKCTLMPRGHYKTSVATIADSLRRLAINPNLRILLANESSENAELMLFEVKQHVLNNKLFRMFYPELTPPDVNKTTWTKNAMLLPRTGVFREPSITAAGVGTAIVSRHFNLLKFDDLVAEDAMDSPTVMQRAIDWLNRSVSLYVSANEDETHLTGTRWAFNDVYGHAMDKMGFTPFIRKAVVEGPDGIQPFFPEEFSLDYFARIIRTNPDQWATQYANDPLDSATAIFKRNWLRFYSVAPDRSLRYTGPDGSVVKQELSRLRVYIHIDPSMGENDRSDYSAIMVVGVNSRGQIFLLEAWRRRLDPIALMDKIFELNDIWNPMLVSVEATAYQKSLVYFFTEEARYRRRYIRMVPIKPSPGKTKAARIKGALQPYFATGSVFVRENQHEFIDEYMSFGRSEHDDLMDALAQGPEVWKAPSDDINLKRTGEHILSFERAASRRRTGVTGYGF